MAQTLLHGVLEGAIVLVAGEVAVVSRAGLCLDRNVVPFKLCVGVKEETEKPRPILCWEHWDSSERGGRGG